MAPKEKAVLDALRKATKSIYKSDPNSLTVRRVRQQVQEDLDIDEDFFANEEWKAKSKELIQKVAVSISYFYSTQCPAHDSITSCSIAYNTRPS